LFFGFRISDFGFLLLALLPLGCSRKPAEPEVTPPAPVKFETRQGSMLAEWTELIGATQPLPNQAARVTAGIEGRVLWLLGDPAIKGTPKLIEGQRVERGQVIGRLDDSVIQANREKLDATVRTLEQEKKQADVAVNVALLIYDTTKRLYKTTTPGVSLPLASEVELKKAGFALEDAESKQKGSAAKLESAKAELKALDEQLKLYALRAPIAGRLGAIQASPGQPLALGATVADITDLDEIDVVCFVPPSTIAKLTQAQKETKQPELQARYVTDRGEIGPNGRVVYIGVQAQPDTGAFPVKVRFNNAELGLRAGAVARVEVMTRRKQKRIAISDKALLEDRDQPVVVIIYKWETRHNKEKDKDEEIGTVRRLQAKIGVRDRRLALVEILELQDVDPESKLPQPVFDDFTEFVNKGAHGLETGDEVKKEEEEDE
jgi:multidrug efflux pump subunit AcrA (membrane-fusion protein)